ncbi:hypothetical protein KC19_12G175800 [Ceratodon purpureus]|uniref:Exostosin GT47 domain-containing protein n=1 Tax=Ceratodon purpureus TaxID=3225 RepID=A0A8T0G8Y0_CERPU|nr:hypothetical protein KC19_12G175800 [Ceratodon purpureus]
MMLQEKQGNAHDQLGSVKEPVQQHHRSVDGEVGTTPGFAKNVAATELQEAAPKLMRASGVVKSGNLLSASTSRLVSCPITSRITFLLGWIFTIFVVFTCEDYTERLANLHNVPVNQDEAGLHANLSSNFLGCEAGLVYVYSIPEAYNQEFVRECATFKKGRDLCMYMENWGMGSRFEFGAEQGGLSTERGPGPWHNTWQFALELYFHERLQRHPCVTDRAELANAFFVPYYAGMDLSRRFTHRLAKDELYMELARWLQGQESWKRRQGRDHFIMLGRIASDFRRPGGDRLWGNELLRQEVFNKMIVLSIERTSGSFRKSASVDKEIAIPYPTYFHDSSNAELQNLIDWIGQTSQRSSLATMAAGQRQASTNRMRHRLMTQCSDDSRCTLLLCVGHEASPSLSEEMRNISLPVKMEGKTLNVLCNNPPVLLSAMHQSEFCLQPPGDSPTRRSFFDAMLVGCIPVIFQKEAAWSQYVHHLPQDGASYSIFIPMTLANKRNVIDILSQVSKSRIHKMRANIARLIPRILYASINEMRSETPETSKYAGSSAEIPDAFDIALDAVLGRINSNLKFSRDANSS